MAIALVIALLGVVQVRWLWHGESGAGWKEIVRSDVRGYYGYLVAVFIAQDLGHEKADGTYVHRTPHGTLNKYFAGTAVMMAPWFGIGHALALLDPDAPKNGHSFWEHVMIGVGALVYVLFGLLMWRALLLRFEVREPVIVWIVVALTLATPLLQYAALQPGWSHVYSFVTFSAFLLLVRKLDRGDDVRWAIVLGAVFGLIVLIRPVNGLVLLAIPIVAGTGTWPMLLRIVNRPAILVLAAAAALVLVAVQPILWHAQTGRWIEWGYLGEGFHWDRPEIFRVLFGFRRGLFLWAPVLLMAALAVPLLWRKDRTRSIWAFTYWTVNIYVIASWWIWYYGSGFGSRVFIEHLVVIALPWALVLNAAKPKTWIAARIFMVSCIALHLFQFWQFHHRILHHESMDRHKYAWAFGRYDPSSWDRLGGNYQARPFNPNGMELIVKEYHNFGSPGRLWQGGRVEVRKEAYSETHVCVFDSAMYGTAFIAPAGELPLGRALQLEASVMRYEEKAGDSFHMIGIASVQRPDGSMAYYEPFRMNLLPGESDSTWTRLCYAIPLPPLEAGQKVGFYFWDQEERCRLLLDDLCMKVWAVVPY
ncbi:MAG: hypothetical protein IPK99_09460 [Flavobacteriales bacterium]|nr:hypothetical protein [Flavobacteriales bacterium]